MQDEQQRDHTRVGRPAGPVARSGRAAAWRALGVLGLSLASVSCASLAPPTTVPVPTTPEVRTERGSAVYYASRFHGRRTASGVRLDNAAMVAAHPSLPFGCVVRVTNLDNQRAVDVTIIDRGPSLSGQRRGIVIDVSQGAARELGFYRRGTAPVEIEIPTPCRAAAAG
jgi:rare lipoprotein A